jgi:hypothetical protein
MRVSVASRAARAVLVTRGAAGCGVGLGEGRVLRGGLVAQVEQGLAVCSGGVGPGGNGARGRDAWLAALGAGDPRLVPGRAEAGGKVGAGESGLCAGTSELGEVRFHPVDHARPGIRPSRSLLVALVAERDEQRWCLERFPRQPVPAST